MKKGLQMQALFFVLIVPTLCVGMPPWTLCVRFEM
jgi:hypothetical protein